MTYRPGPYPDFVADDSRALATVIWEELQQISFANDNWAPFADRSQSELNAGIVRVNGAYPWGHVKRYGAIGNGLVDDTAAIEIALRSGHAVLFGDADCTYLTTGLELEDGGVYWLTGKGATLKHSSGATKDILYNNDSTFVSMLVIEGLRFDGNSSEQTDWDFGGVSVHVDIASVRGCEFFDCRPYHLRFAHVASTARITDCTFHSGVEHTGTLNENSIYLECRSASSRASSTRQNISITGNSFIGIEPSVAGRGVGGVIVSGFSTASADETHRMLVAHNTFWKCGQNAAGNKVASISLYRRGGRSIIQGNWVFESDELGIDVQGSSNVLIQGNLVHGVEGSGIALGQRDGDKNCSEISVLGNVVSGAQAAGIWAYSASGVEHRNITIKGNSVFDSFKGIECRYCDGNLQIEGNSFENILEASPSVGERAIDVYLCDGVISIKNNTLVDSENGFISVNTVTGRVQIEGNSGEDFAETRPIRVITVTGDVAIRNNTLATLATAEVLRLDAITGRVVIEGNTVPDGSTISTGTATQVYMSRNNPGWITETKTGNGAISPFIPHTLLVTTGANTLSLADGVPGQQKLIRHKTDGGSGELTPSNLFGGTKITFTSVDEWALLEFIDSKWLMLGGTAVLS